MSSIHWKSTAKTGTLRVKEFLNGDSQSYTIVLNLPNRADKDYPKILENRVSETASLIYHLIRRGDDVRLKTHEFESPFGKSEAHLESLMTYLAFYGRQQSSQKQYFQTANN